MSASFIPDFGSFSSDSGTGFSIPMRSASRIYDSSPSIGNKYGKIRIEFLDTGPGISEVRLGE